MEDEKSPMQLLLDDERNGLLKKLKPTIGDRIFQVTILAGGSIGVIVIVITHIF